MNYYIISNLGLNYFLVAYRFPPDETGGVNSRSLIFGSWCRSCEASRWQHVVIVLHCALQVKTLWERITKLKVSASLETQTTTTTKTKTADVATQSPWSLLVDEAVFQFLIFMYSHSTSANPP